MSSAEEANPSVLFAEYLPALGGDLFCAAIRVLLSFFREETTMTFHGDICIVLLLNTDFGVAECFCVVSSLLNFKASNLFNVSCVGNVAY